jgi:hypothetical protein
MVNSSAWQGRSQWHLRTALGAEGIATSFRQGRRNLTKVQAVLAALARMGFVSTTDGGQTFALRRVA